MKKTLSLLLALLMLAGCVFALSACGKEKPELDLDDAEKNLKDAGYTVYRTDNEDYLDYGEEDHLYAYNDDDDMLEIIEYESRALAKIAYKHLKGTYEDSIATVKNEISHMEDLLEELEDELTSEEIQEMKDAIDEAKEQLELLEEYQCGRDGVFVWMGTRRAIKDSQ